MLSISFDGSPLLNEYSAARTTGMCLTMYFLILIYFNYFLFLIFQRDYINLQKLCISLFRGVRYTTHTIVTYIFDVRTLINVANQFLEQQYISKTIFIYVAILKSAQKNWPTFVANTSDAYNTLICNTNYCTTWRDILYGYGR